MIERIVQLAILLFSTASYAGEPTGYQCAPGAAKNGVGCSCPSTHVERRDNENTAVCMRRIVTLKPAVGLYDALDPSLPRSKDSCKGIACAKLADKIANGEGVAVDLATAAKHYEQACAAGHARACAVVSFYFDTGTGVAIDKAKAKALQQRACDVGSATTCVVIATEEKDPTKVKSLHGRARVLAETACNQGLPEGCYQLAILHAAGTGVTKDEPKALQLYEQTCKDGYGPSCRQLGFSYEFGVLGTTKDIPRAIQLYERSCNTGDYLGCSSLASLLTDPIQAGLGFAAGCRHGASYGCLMLARWFANTDKSVLDRMPWKVPLTPELRTSRMVEAYTLACNYGGTASACEELGERYMTGNGVAIDKTRARSLFQRVCDAHGFALSCGKAAKLKP